jgi:predicted metal-binding membrane protein
MARQSHPRSHPAQIHRRYRRYRVLGMLPALVLLGGGLYLGLAQGDWIIVGGAALFLLITVMMIGTDKPPALPPAWPPDTAETLAGAAGQQGEEEATSTASTATRTPAGQSTSRPER